MLSIRSAPDQKYFFRDNAISELRKKTNPGSSPNTCDEKKKKRGVRIMQIRKIIF